MSSQRPLDQDLLELRLPTTMLLVSIAAGRLHLPWGATFYRLVEGGVLVESGGVFRPALGGVRAALALRREELAPQDQSPWRFPQPSRACSEAETGPSLLSSKLPCRWKRPKVMRSSRFSTPSFS